MRINKDIFNKHVDVVNKGVVIFREGDMGSEMYVIIEGSVEITKQTASDASKTLITLHNGDIFGEMSLIENKKRSATATTNEPTKLLVLNEHLFNVMIEKNPDFAAKMIRLLSERLRKANVIIQDLASTNKEKQILSGLIEFAQKNSESSFKGKRVNINEFCEWASKHLGIPESEGVLYMKAFISRNIVERSAAGDEYIILPKAKQYN